MENNDILVNVVNDVINNGVLLKAGFDNSANSITFETYPNLDDADIIIRGTDDNFNVTLRGDMDVQNNSIVNFEIGKVSDKDKLEEKLLKSSLTIFLCRKMSALQNNKRLRKP